MNIPAGVEAACGEIISNMTVAPKGIATRRGRLSRFGSMSEIHQSLDLRITSDWEYQATRYEVARRKYYAPRTAVSVRKEGPRPTLDAPGYSESGMVPAEVTTVAPI